MSNSDVGRVVRNVEWRGHLIEGDIRDIDLCIQACIYIYAVC